jgi:hypothetical protein
MQFNKWLLYASLWLMIYLISCGDEPTCVDTDTSLIKIAFLGEDGKAKNIIINSLTAIGNEAGFPEFTNDTTSRISLPLNPGARNTTFILFQPTKTDTIGLSYDVVAKLISPECGLDASFSKLDTTFTTFTKLVIVESIIDDAVTTNIEITH